MNDISLLWTVIFVLSLLQEYRTATLDEAMAVTCRSKDRVSAIVGSYIDPEIALLFSEQYVYQFNPKTETLEDVDEISEVFTGVSEKIEAAFKSNIYDFYYLYSVNYVYHWNRTTKRPKKYSYPEHIDITLKSSNVKLEKYPTCGTTFCESNKNCFFVVIFRMKKYMDCTYPSGTPKGMKCVSETETLKYPDGSSPDGLALNQCQGIMVKENLTGSNEFGVVFADLEKLRVWVGRKIVFESTLDELFKCSSSLAIIIIILFGIIAIVVILVSVSLIFGKRCFRKRRRLPDESRASITRGSKSWNTRDRKRFRAKNVQ